jgi:hypothetical protein
MHGENMYKEFQLQNLKERGYLDIKQAGYEGMD